MNEKLGRAKHLLSWKGKRGTSVGKATDAGIGFAGDEESERIRRHAELRHGR
jgi:hypothetical protein